MNLTQAEIRQRQEATRFQLVATELDLAITFCQVATTTNDPARYARNVANAQQAYSSAVHLLRRNHLKAPLELEINEKLKRVNSLLRVVVPHNGETRGSRVSAFSPRH